MKFPRRLVTLLVFTLSFSLVEVVFSLNAHAVGMMIPTSQVVSNEARATNLKKVEGFIARADVQRELIKRGVSPQEATMRVASLSDFELQKLAGNVDNAPAGAEAIVIGLGTLIVIVLLILLLRR